MPNGGLSGDAPRVSLCMIAKNEEAFLAECLASVRGIVDEAIVVDTGSTDRTV
ncbi:MAG: glycosyltransferase, partial [Planctomycetota bacterium]